MDKAIICDLDGTLCNINHRLHYIEKENKDWEAFGSAKNIKKDTPILACVELLEAMENKGYTILFISGRTYRPSVKLETDRWIQKYTPLTRYEVFLRPNKNVVSALKLKPAIYDLFVKDTYDVLFAIDNEPEGLEMYRKLGVPGLLILT